MQKVIENIRKYGNKNSCYIPFLGGGILSTEKSRLCTYRVYGNMPDNISKRLQRS